MSSFWQIEIPIIVRNLINDLAYPPTYSDARIEQLILVAAQYVISEANLETQYIVDIVGGEINLYNCIMNESSEAANYGWSDGRINSQNHDNTPNYHYIFADFGNIRSTTAVRHTDSGIAWAIAPTTVSRSVDYPLELKIATVAVSANSLVTVKAWMRRTSVSLTMRLRIRGGQIAGVDNDVTAEMTASQDTWQQVSLSFTPAEDGVIDVYAEAYGGTTHTGYVDDISITQV